MSLPTTPRVLSAYPYAGPRRQTPNVLPEESEEPQRADSVLGSEVLDDQNVPRETVASKDGDEDITMSDSSPGNVKKKRLNQIIQHFYVKAAHIILGSRTSLPVRLGRDGTRKVDKWFQLETDHSEAFSEVLELWKHYDVFEERPPSLIVETYLDARDFTTSHHSDNLAVQGAFWRSHTEIVLERWEIQLKDDDVRRSGDLSPSLTTTYKSCIILCRSLYAMTKLLPVWRFIRGRTEAPGVKCRVVKGSEYRRLFTDAFALLPDASNHPITTLFYLGEIDSPVGSLAIKVEYRNELKFPVNNPSPSKQSHIIEGEQTKLEPDKQQNVQPDTKESMQKSPQDDRKASEVSCLPRPISMTDDIMDFTMPDMEDNNEWEKLRRLDIWKCKSCRDLYKRCSPTDRVWPQKCERCLQHQPELECSEPQLQTLKRHRRDSPVENDTSGTNDDYWTRGRQRGGSVHSRASSRGSSPASLRGISLAPMEFKPSELPSLRHSYSNPDLQSTEWTGIRSRRGSAASDQSLVGSYASSSFTRRPKHLRRQRITQDQLVILEMEFKKNPTPSASVRELIAEDISMTERSVQIWFQNRRAKLKLLAKKSIQTGEDSDAMIPEPMRQYLALHGMDLGKSLGSNFPGGSGPMPYGSGNMLMGGDQGPQGKLVIKLLSCRSLSVGTWRRVGQNAMDLIVFYSPDKACMTYYINTDQACYKIEYPFAFIKNVFLENEDNETLGGLVVELNRPPNFFLESSGSGGFYQCGDFTEDQQASQIMIHHLGGSPKVLSQQLAMLISLESFITR